LSRPVGKYRRGSHTETIFVLVGTFSYKSKFIAGLIVFLFPQLASRCAAEHQSFRIAEFEALFSLFQIQYVWVEKDHEKPWVILKFGSVNDVFKILSR